MAILRRWLIRNRASPLAFCKGNGSNASARDGPRRTAEKMMRKLVILAVLAASLSVAACNTVEGAGKDVSSAGKAVTDTARDVKKN